MSIAMHIQNLLKFYIRVLKILSRNETMTDERMDEQTDEQNDRQPKSNIAPTFSKRGYNNIHPSLALVQPKKTPQFMTEIL